MIKYIIIFLLLVISIRVIIRFSSHISKQKSYLELWVALTTLALTIYSIMDQKWSEHQHQQYLYQSFIEENKKNMTALENINSESNSTAAKEVQLNSTMIRQYVKEDGPKITDVYLLNKLISDIDLYNQINVDIQHYRYASDIQKVVQSMMQQVMLSKKIQREYSEYDLQEFASKLSHIEVINTGSLISGPACKT